MEDKLIGDLARLKSRSDAPASDGLVAADLERGRRALRGRRRRRGAIAGAVAVVAVAAGSLSYVFVPSGSDSTPAAAPSARVTHGSTPSHSSSAASRSTSPSQPAQSLELVAYHGLQKKGYTVSHVPQGYVLQGVSASVLDVAPASNHTSLNTFVDKLVVMVSDDYPPIKKGAEQVTVHGRPAYLRGEKAGGTPTLEYMDSGHHVVIQQWSSIKLSKANLIRFADGVHLTGDVVTGHG